MSAHDKAEFLRLNKRDGEIYIGSIGNQTGDVYHLILLVGDNDRATHAAQLEWAKSIGGDLPNKLEAMMLFAHAKDQFQETAYWVSETYIYPDDPEDLDYAWYQYFRYGYQDLNRKNDPLRARAVRRLPI